jgi:DNA polymerase
MMVYDTMKFAYDGGFIIYCINGRRRLFLFLKNPDGWLDIPKGHLEKGEGYNDAAIREAYEETGLVVHPEHFFSYTTSYWFVEKKSKVKKTLRIFMARVPCDSKITISDEHSGYEWLDFDDAIRKISFRDMKAALSAANEYIDRVAMMHDLNEEYRALPGISKGWALSYRFVPGEGALNARVMIVGQAPGRDEDSSARPFVGRSGELLNELIKIAGLDRHEVYITSVVQFFPPGNRAPREPEIRRCLPFLLKQVEIINPEIIVMLGSVSAGALYDKVKVLEKHGSVVEMKGRKYFITLHPAAAIRLRKHILIIKEDFKKLRTILKTA